MILSTDIKGKKQKININAKKKIDTYKNYQQLPGVYVTAKEILKETKKAGLIQWNKQKVQ